MADRELVFKDIEKVLLEELPELRAHVERKFGSYYDLKKETPEAYPIFEGVLKRFLLELLEADVASTTLSRIFSFIEEMAESRDRDVTDLLGIAILEPLVFDRERIGRAWKYMGERTRELAKENARSGGWLDNLPRGASSPTNGH